MKGLAIVVVSNVALLIATSAASSLSSFNMEGVAKVVSTIAPFGLAVIVVGVLSGQISGDLKAQLVHFKIKNALPGARAFSEIAAKDPRVDITQLTSKMGNMPETPEAQNAAWYGIYLSYRDDPAVRQSHRSYLFSRDYNFLSLIMLLAFTPLSIFTIEDWAMRSLFWGFLVLQFLLTGQAARTYGCRMVSTVLALYSHSK